MIYVTYLELFNRLYPSSYVSYKSTLALSNKTGNVFEYSGSSFTVEIGDKICQGEFASTITNVLTGPDRIELADATNIADGDAYVFRTSKTLEEFEMYVTISAQKIDLYTGQWFNEREFVGANAIKIEGNNTHVLYLSVPIIEISSLKTNNLDEEEDPDNYVVYASRTIPDDRKNPRIKMLSETNTSYLNRSFMNQYKTGVFCKHMFQHIEGKFGYLEADGSTPEAIKWALTRLVAIELGRDITNTSSASIKREKTDLHEIEYDTDTKSGTSGTNAPMTGDPEVDRVLLMYKAPMAIAACDPLYSTIVPFHQTQDRWGYYYAP